MNLRVDLNCDLGESLGRWHLGADEQLMRLVSSANVACGFHAGDPLTMQRTVRLAAELGVAVGAHPGLPDLIGFGRRVIEIDVDDAHAIVLYQAGALAAFLAPAGLSLAHVKPHGALYTMAARRLELADAIAAASAELGPEVALVGPAGSRLEESALRRRVPFAAEVFADREYLADGRLVPRSTAGAVIEDPNRAATRAVTMVCEGRVEAISGEWLSVRADTICVHGDAPNAVAIARAVRRALEDARVAITPPEVGRR